MLLACAARVAYVYVAGFLDDTMQDNFTTPTVSELNNKVIEIGVST